MRDSKSLFFIFIACILSLVAFIVISIWGYNYYFQKDDEPRKIAKVEGTQLSAVKDSDTIKSINNNSIPDINEAIDSIRKVDSLDPQLNLKLAELDSLKNEIEKIIRNKSANSKSPQDNTDQLQQNITQLETKNKKVTAENARLQRLLAKANKIKNATQQKTNASKTTSPKPISNTTTITQLKFSAISNEGSITSIGANTVSMTGSFTLQNNPGLKSNDFYIVIIQPNGQVLQEAWESGIFATPAGKKVYSSKILFSGEGKNLSFSIKAPSFQKGNYKMLVYYDGKILATINKKLT